MSDCGLRRKPEGRDLLKKEDAVAEDHAIELPEGIQITEFRPVAYFDRHMDCIRVLTHDRSVTEHRINEYFTVYEANFRTAFDPKYVGFTIKGVRQLFHEVGLPLDGTYKLVDIIDRLVKHRPGSAISALIDIIFAQVAPGDLSVHVEDAA